MDDREWAQKVIERIYRKEMEVVRRNADRIPYTTEDGRFDDWSGEDKICWWTNGFWAGQLWQLYHVYREDSFRETAERIEDKLDQNLMNYMGMDHDSGFKWLLTAGADYMETGNEESKNRLMLAAGNLAGRLNLNAGMIRAWNDTGSGETAGWAIIDCMMNLPLLYRASELTNDSRIFKHIKNFYDPVVMPRQETKITYPYKESKGVWKEVEKKAEIFEGLCRSLFIAAPLMKNDPELTVCGYRLAEYYKSHILRVCMEGDAVSVSNYERLQEMTGYEDTFRAFQVYAPLWNVWYGYENAPGVAEKFEEYSNRLMETYPDFFDADGYTNMWGRSNIYRFAAVSALEENLHVRNPKIDPGLARRICSGSLLQFLGREDFYWQGIPTMGFYGQFAPLVQGYSCAESPFWMGKVFLCLVPPEEHPFWTEKEKNGTWENLQKEEVKTTVLDGPALCVSDHQANGTTILRTGKVVKNCGDEHGMWNYAKLAYCTKYPWEASPSLNTGAGFESQQYVLLDNTDGTLEKCNVTLWYGEREGVLYRRQFFNYTLERECMWMQAVNLADFTVPYGLIRVDKMRLFRRPVTLTLGAWGFPDHGTECIRKNLWWIFQRRNCSRFPRSVIQTKCVWVLMGKYGFPSRMDQKK